MSAVEIRPIRQADAAALRRFHAGLSADTTRKRFLYVHPTLSEREVTWFTTVDHDRREALVAVLDGDIVGVARYDRIDRDTAEVAIVVTDAWQGTGVGTELLTRLVDRARAAGITGFVADALPDNHAIVRLLGRAATAFERHVDCGVAHIRIALPGGARGVRRKVGASCV